MLLHSYFVIRQVPLCGGVLASLLIIHLFIYNTFNYIITLTIVQFLSSRENF